AASRALSSRPLLASESASVHAPVPAFTHNPRHVRPTSPKFRRVAQNATRSGCKSPVRGRLRCPVFREFPGLSPKLGHDIAATLGRGRWARAEFCKTPHTGRCGISPLVEVQPGASRDRPSASILAGIIFWSGSQVAGESGVAIAVAALAVSTVDRVANGADLARGAGIGPV